MKITAREVAEYLGVDYVVAAGFMSMLMEKGVAKHTENRKNANGKGKPTRVFEVDRVITLELAAPPQTQDVDTDVEDEDVDSDDVDDVDSEVEASEDQAVELAQDESAEAEAA